MADYKQDPTQAEILAGENAALRRQLAEYREREAARERDARGYDQKGQFLVCRYDRIVIDDMDVHDRQCADPAKRNRRSR